MFHPTKLASGTLLALLASQVTGCVLHDDDRYYEEDAFITAAWTFENIATGSVTDCPSGFHTVRLVSQPVDARFEPIGEPFVDLFDCFDDTHTSEPLPPDVYQVWLEVVSDRGDSLYAQSTSQIVDVIDRDARFDATILNDGGYFMLDWVLRGRSTNTQLSCTGVDSVEILSTLSGSTDAIADKFNCDDHFGITGGLLAGSYTLSVAALDREDRSLGTAPALTNQVILDRNRVTDLGLITIPIDSP